MAENRDRFQKAMNQGHSAAWDQTWEKAAGFYRQALEEFPEDPKALTSLALALNEMGDYKNALQVYQRAARTSPEDPIPMEKVAELYERMGKNDHAIDAYMRSAEMYVKSKEINKCIDLWQHVTNLSPTHLAAYSRLALLYERLGRKAEAVKTYLVIASLLQHKGDIQKATQAATHAQQLMPESGEANQALNQIKMNRPLPAPSPARTSNEIPPAFRPKPAVVKSEDETPRYDPISAARQQAMGELAKLLFETMEAGGSDKISDMSAILRGKPAQAARSNTDRLEGQVDVTRIVAYLSQVVDYLSRKEDSLAIADLEHALEAGLGHPAAYCMLGSLLVEAGRMENGVVHLQRAASSAELGLGVNLLLGKTLLKMQRTSEAAAALLEALKLADMHAVAPEQAESLAEMYIPLIEAQTQPGQNGSSTQLCETIIDLLLSPDWLERVRHTRSQLSPNPETGEVTPVADLLMEGVSGEIVDSLGRIQKLTRAGKYQPAMEEAYLAVSIAPFYLPLHIAMGDLLQKQGQTAAALEKYSTVARSYVIREEKQRAIAIYRKVIEIAPMDLKTRMTLVELLRAAGDAGQALNEFARIADMYYAMADLSTARATLAQALQMAQENNLNRGLRAGLLSRIADIDMQSLDWRAALRTYEQIRLLQPEDEQTRLTLIELNFRLNLANQANIEINNYLKYLVENQRQAQAIAFIEKVADNHPDQAGVQRMLGDAYRQAGRAGDAIQRYEDASDLFARAGNRAAAADALLALLALNPPNPEFYQRTLNQLRT